MVQSKQKKAAKPKKHQDAVKKNGKQADIGQLRSQLDGLGLKIIQVTSDGNCFFRVLADQLEGNEEEHIKYRLMIVQYILKHREDFEPFIEDEVPFDEYCKSMEEDGTWAGNMELQAASLVTQSNICIHRNMSPRWYIRNFHSHKARMVHLSYHNGEHYNSVRLKEDPCDGPAKHIVIKVDADVSSIPSQAKTTIKKTHGVDRENISDMSSVKLVMIGTGCKDLNKVKQVLQEVDGDVDATIEYLIAEKEMNEDVNSENEISCENDASPDHENGKVEQPMEDFQDTKCESNISSSNIESAHDLSIQEDDKKIARNKLCPCGSKKKHKACCGSSAGKFSVTSVSNRASKGRKDRRSNRKGEAAREAPTRGSTVLPDVGALCI